MRTSVPCGSVVSFASMLLRRSARCPDTAAPCPQRGGASVGGRVVVTIWLTTGPGSERLRSLSTPEAAYQARVEIAGACSGKGMRGRCLAVRGRLSGAGQDEKTEVPDQGGNLRFGVGPGTLAPLGRVTPSCKMFGVGFIKASRRAVWISIHAADGAELRISAHGPLVRGFSGL